MEWWKKKRKWISNCENTSIGMGICIHIWRERRAAAKQTCSVVSNKKIYCSTHEMQMKWIDLTTASVEFVLLFIIFNFRLFSWCTHVQIAFSTSTVRLFLSRAQEAGNVMKDCKTIKGPRVRESRVSENLQNLHFFLWFTLVGCAEAGRTLRRSHETSSRCALKSFCSFWFIDSLGCCSLVQKLAVSI